VLVEPYHAKQMLELLTRVLSTYESQYGKIEQPKAIKVAEDAANKSAKGAGKLTAKNDASIPSYFG
jgi:hypothetical protein